MIANRHENLKAGLSSYKASSGFVSPQENLRGTAL